MGCFSFIPILKNVLGQQDMQVIKIDLSFCRGFKMSVDVEILVVNIFKYFTSWVKCTAG